MRWPVVAERTRSIFEAFREGELALGGREATHQTQREGEAQDEDRRRCVQFGGHLFIRLNCSLMLRSSTPPESQLALTQIFNPLETCQAKTEKRNAPVIYRNVRHTARAIMPPGFWRFALLARTTNNTLLRKNHSERLIPRASTFRDRCFAAAYRTDRTFLNLRTDRI